MSRHRDDGALTLSGEPYAAIAETHTGVVVFLGDRAYKLKRPVEFAFLDNRDVDARRRTCAEEVDLNRRLAPDVYLGVGALVAPDDEPDEPLVVMRRLPAERRLTRLVQSGAPVEDHLRHIAHQLATLHAAAHPTAVAAMAAGVESTRERWSAERGRARHADGTRRSDRAEHLGTGRGGALPRRASSSVHSTHR